MSENNNGQHGSSDDSEITAAEKHLDAANGEIPNDREGDIVSRVQFVDSAGNVGEKIHGPMPRSEWAEYSKKNGL